MRQLKALLLAALALVFVAGVGTGAFVGSLAAATREPDLDRRVRDFQRAHGLSPTQVRQLREILRDHDQKKEKIRQSPEVQKAIWALDTETLGHIRRILTEEQRRAYDSRMRPR